MIRTLALSLLLIGGFACKKQQQAPAKEKTATASSGTVGADGVRKINVEASKEGYAPDRVVGKPGEKLVLVFKRTVEGDCLATVTIADGKPIDLPMNTPVDVPVTVPASGELAFVCSMGMFKGTIVADPKG